MSPTKSHLEQSNLRLVEPTAPILLPVRPLHAADFDQVDNTNTNDWLVSLSQAARRSLIPITTILIPMLVATTYYLLLLSDQYVSETRFVIRSMVNPGLGGLAIMTQNQGLARTEDDTHLVNEFLKSRDAVRMLTSTDNLKSALGRKQGDIFHRFPTLLSGSTQEDLFEHFQSFIDVSYQSTTGITTLKVRAFTPEDAQKLASALLRHAENVVNQLNRRARADAVRFSESIANAAEKRVINAQTRIAEFRNRELVLDPGKQSAATLELVNKLLSERLALDTTLTETRTVTPNSPRIAAIENRLSAIDQQIENLRTGLAGNKGSMASKLAEFERLSLERELATKSLAAALSSLENARQDAARQQLYLERVVQPNRPDKSQYPQRLVTLAFILAFCIALYWITKSLADVVMAHDA